MIAIVAVVVGFGSSSQLAPAYGIAVVGAMIIDAILACIVAITLWRWHPVAAGLAFASFLAVDLAFFGSNALKIPAGEWFPIAFAAAVFALMSTWRTGRESLFQRLYRGAPSLPSFLASLARRPPVRVPGTAVFLTGNPDTVRRALLHNLKHNRVLHEDVVVPTVQTEEVLHSSTSGAHLHCPRPLHLAMFAAGSAARMMLPITATLMRTTLAIGWTEAARRSRVGIPSKLLGRTSRRRTAEMLNEFLSFQF